MMENEAAKGCGQAHYTSERVRRMAYLPAPARGLGAADNARALARGAGQRAQACCGRWARARAATALRMDLAGAHVLQSRRGVRALS